MALTADVLFANPEYLKRITQIGGVVDDAWIAPAMIIAQDKYLQIYLGTKLYEKLKTDISGNSLSEPYTTLMDDHVRKVTAWWTCVELIPNLSVQVDNAGLVQRTPSNASPASPQQVSHEANRCRNTAQFYTQQMYRYLCNNTELFPEYSQSDPGDILPESAYYTQNGYTITGPMPRANWRQYIG
jgi:hypothetical protein